MRAFGLIYLAVYMALTIYLGFNANVMWLGVAVIGFIVMLEGLFK